MRRSSRRDIALYKVNLDIFEGPLDLLLFLIRKNEIDIHDIFKLQVCAESFRQNAVVLGQDIGGIDAGGLPLCRNRITT